MIKRLDGGEEPLEIPSQNPAPSAGGEAETAADTARAPLDREALGRRVREVWLEWARVQTRHGRSWLLTWEELTPEEREVDRLIGETIAREATTPLIDRIVSLEGSVALLDEQGRKMKAGREADHAAFSRTLSERDGDVGHANDEIERLKAELAANEEALVELAGRAQKATMEREAALSDLEDERKVNAGLGASLEALQKDIAKTKPIVEAAERRLTELEDDHAQWSPELIDLRVLLAGGAS